MSDLIQIGAISSTHGVRGEVKIYPTTDDVKRFKKLKKCILDTGKEKRELEVESCKFFKEVPILKFKGIDNINDVEGYKRCGLFVTRENAVALGKDEYFISDIIGSQVFDEEEELLGELKDVLITGANDVYVVETKDNKELLIPAIKQCIRSVDVDNQIIKVHLLEGLVE